MKAVGYKKSLPVDDADSLIDFEAAKPEPVPVKIETPAKQEVAYTPQVFEKEDAADTAGVEGEPVKAAPAPEAAPLPKTASPIYFVGLLGLMLVALSLLVRRVSAQSN